MKTKLLYIILLLLVFFLGKALPSFAEGTNGILEGQAFIVTKAAENIRLGLVEVSVAFVSENDITNYIAERNKWINDDRPDFETRIAEFDTAISETKTNIEKVNGLEEIAHATGDDTTVRDGAQTFKKSLALLEQMKKSKEKEKESWPASSHYFKDLPASLASTRTDADGKFSLPMPKQGKFAIAAHASRRTPSANEDYYWMVWVSLNGKDSANIILGNQNFMSSGSQDSVVSTKSD